MQEEACTPSLPKSPLEITAPKSPEKVLGTSRLDGNKISAVDVLTYDPLVQDYTTPDLQTKPVSSLEKRRVKNEEETVSNITID